MKKIVSLFLLLLCFPSFGFAKSALTVPGKISAAMVEQGYEISFTADKAMASKIQTGNVIAEIDIKTSDKWSSQQGKTIQKKISSAKGGWTIVLTNEELDTILPSADSYSFRVRFLAGKEKSDFSSIVTLGRKNVFSNYSSWAKNDLLKAQDKKWITSSMKDNMKGKITREELAEVMVKVYEQQNHKSAQGNKNHFTDTKNSYVNMAVDLHLMNGVSKNTFHPKGSVSRQDYAVVLSQLMSLETKSKVTIKDKQNIGAYALSAVEKAVSNGLLHVDEKGKFQPKKEMSREEVLSSLVRSFQ